MMKHFFLGYLLIVLADTTVHGQSAIYFQNNNRQEGELSETTNNGKLKFAVKRGGRSMTYSFRRESILLAFNEFGAYQVIADLSEDPAQSAQQIEAFKKAKPLGNTDYIVQKSPALVIPALISYESDAVINYQTIADQQAASINKTNVVAVVYKDGRHLLVGDGIEDAYAILKELKGVFRVETATRAAQKPESAKTAVQKSDPVAVVEPKPADPPTTRTAEQIPTETITVGKNETRAANAQPAKPFVARTERSKSVLSEQEYQTYRQKAIDNVHDFSTYLQVITNKKAALSDKDKAVEEAVKLFMPGSTIEVTSVNNAKVNRYPVREYLKRLRLLPYSSTSIEWTEVQYIQELSQAADGNYYGTIRGQQTFIGYGNNGQDTLYSDVTTKNVKVKLESYQKQIDGNTIQNWGVLLGNVGVESK